MTSFHQAAFAFLRRADSIKQKQEVREGEYRQRGEMQSLWIGGGLARQGRDLCRRALSHRQTTFIARRREREKTAADSQRLRLGNTVMWAQHKVATATSWPCTPQTAEITPLSTCSQVPLGVAACRPEDGAAAVTSSPQTNLSFKNRTKQKEKKWKLQRLAPTFLVAPSEVRE